MKILTIVGARPQFVKAAALSREIRKNSQLQEIIVHTGQHFDTNMSDIFFEEMDIPKPNYNLNINGLSHGAMTGQMLEGIEKIILSEKPDTVLAYGDTNSTLAGALAAKKLHVKVAHVEAGLRSFNMKMPEEINRILTDRISDWLFCPTDTAVSNLIAEGLNPSNIYQCGDVMEDAALYYAAMAEQKSTILQTLSLQDQPFVLATLHRAENTDNPTRLKQITEAINTIHRHTKVVIPLHPRTRNKLAELNLNLDCITIDPIGYFDMLSLLTHCSLVITDSGGLQKEAFFFRKHCLTTRTETEWVELVTNGYNTLTDSDTETIIARAQQKLNEAYPDAMNLYGNGKACERICQVILA
jgi:UDP-GlcNAc3NAcA epimerase